MTAAEIEEDKAYCDAVSKEADRLGRELPARMAAAAALRATSAPSRKF